MPFTPLHVGPALALGLPLRTRLHLPTFIISSVAIDVEPLLVFILGLAYPLHGYLHTFLLALPYGALVGLAIYLLEPFLGRLWRSLLLEVDENARVSTFIAAGVVGSELHVLLDAPLYSDIRPFYPLSVNPLYYPSLTPLIYEICILAWIAGIALYLAILMVHLYKRLAR